MILKMTREKSNAFERPLKIEIIFQTTLKMLKKRYKYIKNIFFLDFRCFSLFLDFSKFLSKRWVKN